MIVIAHKDYRCQKIVHSYSLLYVIPNTDISYLRSGLLIKLLRRSFHVTLVYFVRIYLRIIDLIKLELRHFVFSGHVSHPQRLGIIRLFDFTNIK
jgi:hypothetical protein